MSKHTLELLRLAGGAGDGYSLIASSGRIVATAGFASTVDAREIVSRWNACAGINPKAVPKLLEALRAIDEAGMLPSLSSLPNTDTIVGRATRLARDALALAEKE